MRRGGGGRGGAGWHGGAPDPWTRGAPPQHKPSWIPSPRCSRRLDMWSVSRSTNPTTHSSDYGGNKSVPNLSSPVATTPLRRWQCGTGGRAGAGGGAPPPTRAPPPRESLWSPAPQCSRRLGVQIRNSLHFPRSSFFNKWFPHQQFA
jgi:hypothetical protein